MTDKKEATANENKKDNTTLAKKLDILTERVNKLSEKITGGRV